MCIYDKEGRIIALFDSKTGETVPVDPAIEAAQVPYMAYCWRESI